MTLLALDRLSVSFATSRGDLHALDSISFAVNDGESVGLVGESGCGKTTIARAILRVLPNNAASRGRILFRDQDLLAMSIPEVRKIRWSGMALVTQSAMNALDPVYRVGAQIVEAIRTHEHCSESVAWERAAELFETVGLKSEWVRRYPHEFSGGMRQRAIIAMALALNPPLIIADEPTTALDVIMQDQVFTEIDRIRKTRGTALILITHDISLVSENCNRVVIMYAGQIAEMAPTRAIFDRPMHPYTIGLQNAFADLADRGRDLISIAGAPPDLVQALAGCRFAPRCPFARDKCREPPPLLEREEGHWVACHFADEAETFRRAGREEKTWEAVAAASVTQ
jgi:oligopeptide/dipeptide ABC transporter ATP-binding protein